MDHLTSIRNLLRGRARGNWANLWKPTIDSLGSMLGGDPGAVSGMSATGASQISACTT